MTEVTADEFRSMIGTPPLIKGESVDEYWTWWSAFVDEYAPKSLSDWFEINEMARNRWEERRLRRCASARINGALVNVLRVMLIPHTGAPIKLAERYYSDDEEERREARELVEGYAITEDQIMAAAIQKYGRELLIFDRMESYRTTTSRSLRRDIDRRAEARRGSSDQTGKQ
jgi:hypothetical protein